MAPGYFDQTHRTRRHQSYEHDDGTYAFDMFDLSNALPSFRLREARPQPYPFEDRKVAEEYIRDINVTHNHNFRTAFTSSSNNGLGYNVREVRPSLQQHKEFRGKPKHSFRDDSDYYPTYSSMPRQRYNNHDYEYQREYAYSSSDKPRKTSKGKRSTPIAEQKPREYFTSSSHSRNPFSNSQNHSYSYSSSSRSHGSTQSSSRGYRTRTVKPEEPYFSRSQSTSSTEEPFHQPKLKSVTNHYAILGVSRNVTADELKKAYRSLCLQNHPDRVSDANKKAAHERMTEINCAYETLKKKVTR